MPICTIEGAPLDNLDTKRTLVKELTASMAKAYNLPESAFVILLKENTTDNVAVAGELISDRDRK